VVLPPWLDCYDFANRVEHLGLGRWGSKRARPRWQVDELASALIEVVLERREEFARRSRELAEVCRRETGGRTAAAQEVLKMIKDRQQAQV